MMDYHNNGQMCYLVTLAARQMHDTGKAPGPGEDAEETEGKGVATQEPPRRHGRRVRLYVGQRLIAAGEALLRQPWDAAIKPDYDA